MNNHWLLQGNLINQNQMEIVRQSVEKIGDTYSTVLVFPLGSGFEFFDGVPDKNIIPYGSVDLQKYARDKYLQGLFFNENFKVSEWIKQREDMVNSSAIVLRSSDIEKVNLKDNKYFIRPNEDFKHFSGEVLPLKKIINLLKNISSDVFVAISEPVEILQEWRWFVVDGKIIDGSSYINSRIRINKHEEDKDIIDEAQDLADLWLPHETCCMDTALYIRNGELTIGVLEFNNINTTGFYGHDILKIVNAISKYYTRIIND